MVMFDAVISHQSGTKALQVAGAAPTVVDQTQEHILSQFLTPSRMTAAFKGIFPPCSEPRKTSCATDMRVGTWELKLPADPLCALRTGLKPAR